MSERTHHQQRIDASKNNEHPLDVPDDELPPFDDGDDEAPESVEEHLDDAYGISESDEITLSTSDGVTITATCTEKESQHPQDPEQVWEQTTWTLEADDGETYSFGRMDGLSPTGNPDAYPVFFPVTREVEEYRAEIPEEDQHGFIVELEEA